MLECAFHFYILPSKNVPVSVWLNSGIIVLNKSIKSSRAHEPAERSERMQVVLSPGLKRFERWTWKDYS
jgi:hypothetical protein